MTIVCLLSILIGLVTSTVVWSRDRGHGGGRHHSGHSHGGYGVRRHGSGYGGGRHNRGFGSRRYGSGFQGGFGHRNRYGNAGSGFYFNTPIYPYYPRQTPYYPQAVITVPATPPVYIRQPPVAQQYPENYWYYCNNPEGYYPHVKDCRSGWQQVKPTPPR